VGCVEESFTITNTIIAPVPDCTVLTLPLDGATEVEVHTDISWAPVANADGYRITVGTTSGGNEVLSNVDLGNVTTHDLATDLPEDTQIFVTLTPYNAEGDATACTQASFTTELIPVPPACTTLSNPLNGTTNVPVDTGLAWNAIPDATGYLVVVGTTQGGNEVVNQVDVGNATTFSFPDDLRTNRTYYVSIIPYNNIGDALACTEESFRTGAGTLNDPPACTALVSPLNGATDIAISTDLSWTAAANTDGYRLTLGTSTGGNDLLDNLDVGNVTTYDLPADLPENTTIYLTLVPYNANGSATACTEESFSTETLTTVPACTQLTAPLNGATDVAVDIDMSWTASPTATGYKINMGTTSGATDILNAANVGNITTYDLAADLDGSTTYFVTIIPYNAEGDALGCTEESFTTETVATVPACTQLTDPMNNATGVFVDSDISWAASATATGYRIRMGTTSGGNDILDQLDVGNVTTYDLPNDLPGLSPIFVTLTPYNAVGDAVGCAEERFDTNVAPSPPACTNLLVPTPNAVGVALDTDISWIPLGEATGYRLTVATSSGGNDIVDNVDVGANSTYDLPDDLPENTTIYVSVVPYNAVGNASGCTENSFTTLSGAAPPNCTAMTSPLNGATNVPLDANIEWAAVPEALGYRITVGSVNGGGEITLNEDVGLVTSYSFGPGWVESVTYYVTIVPYNAAGDALGCAEESFVTVPPQTIPDCPLMVYPSQGDTAVPVDTALTWQEVPQADGYRISLGTMSGQYNLLSAMDVGAVTTYQWSQSLPEGQDIYLLVEAYNTAGTSAFCDEIRFTTLSIPDPPPCAALVQPATGDTEVAVDTILEWEAIDTATGYRLGVGTSPGSDDLLPLVDLGLLTSYQLASDLPYESEIFITIIPYNEDGDATGCTEQSFTTIEEPVVETQYGFSPDGDGINEFWEIKGIEQYPNNVVTIYNRWGDAVFKISGYDNTSQVFRGQANQLTNRGGDTLPEGTYFFQIDISESHNLKATQGFLVLKR
jgi:gliding motility-associated-like protein